VARVALVAIVSFNGDVLRVRRIDRPLIGFIAVETDAITGFEFEGLIGGHGGPLRLICTGTVVTVI
jgi:hypothetical protein